MAPGLAGESTAGGRPLGGALDDSLSSAGSARLEEALAAGRVEIAAALGPLLDHLLAGVPAALAEPIRYAVEGGGKRLRPVLCLAAYDAAGGRPPGRAAAAELACALELVHTYSLVHDDLPCMDDDDLRRGRPSTHRVFGVARATVAGVALIPLAAAAALRAGESLGLDERCGAQLVRDLCAAAGGGGMVAGQWQDLAAEGQAVSAAQLEAIHLAKTGALMAAAARLGGRAARGGPDVLRALGEYGRRLGLAFQIADDILDVTGRDEVLGKTAGRDRALQKATYPALLGLEGARRRAREEAAAATAALRRLPLRTPILEGLARYAVERDR